jgi:uncharacterized protein (DUF2141 family)
MPTPSPWFSSALRCGWALSLASLASPLLAAELSVTLRHTGNGAGEIGCALFASAEGFPSAAEVSAQRWQPAVGTTAQCRFENLPAGRYAVAASLDLNGNRRTDTHWTGLPTEAWGVSNNVRPRLRAPRFEEAAVDLAEDESRQIEIEVRR